MPMPIPVENEEKTEFLARFMADPEMVKEYPDTDQRYAVGLQAWEGKAVNSNMSEKITLEDGSMIRTHKLLTGRTIYNRRYGELPINEALIDEIVQNYNSNVMEVIPFVDKEHERKEAYGQIVGVKKQADPDGVPSLYIDIEWNNDGVEMIRGKRYMYLSADIEPYINSKTGQETQNVLVGAALVNWPGDKAQEPLVLSDTSAVMAASEYKIGGSNMTPEMQKMIEDLLAVYANAEDAVKMEIKAALVNAMGEQEVEQEIEPETETADKKAVCLSDSKEAVLQAEFLKLSDTHKKTVDELTSLKRDLKLRDFKSEYLGKKITPDQLDSFSRLYLADETAAKEILDKMPDLNLTSEIGVTAPAVVKLGDDDKAIMTSAKMDPENPEHVAAYLARIK